MSDNLFAIIFIGIPIFFILIDLSAVIICCYRSNLFNVILVVVAICLQFISLEMLFWDGVVADSTGGTGNIFANWFASGIAIVSAIMLIANIAQNLILFNTKK